VMFDIPAWVHFFISVLFIYVMHLHFE
jgi:hypothetical protein